MPENEIDKILKSVSNNISNLELEQLKEDLRITKFKLQEILDELEGRIKSSNLIEDRDIYVFNDYGILDANYPFIIDFELVKGMTKLVECKVSFKIRNFNTGVKGFHNEIGIM